MSELGGEFLLRRGDEGIIKVFFHEVDGAAAKAAAHHAGTGYATFLGDVVEVPYIRSPTVS